MTITIHGDADRRPVDSLVPYARNSRTHSETQLTQLVKAFIEFGFTMPVLIDETGGIIAGHARVMAAQRLAMPEVPVIVASGWSEAQRRAYVIADNKLPELAGWDDNLLGAELIDLQLEGFDLAMTGFDEKELAVLLQVGAFEGDHQKPAPKRKPAAPAAAIVSRPGDVWTIGAHRVMCGDAEPELVDAIVQRWQRLTKKTATLSTGQGWGDVVLERAT